jgi:hypothetical protein
MLREVFLPITVERVAASLDAARSLLASGFPSPAFVWAVRSGEILFREMVLFPIHFEKDGVTSLALRKARQEFGGGDWKHAFDFARTHHGIGTTEDPPLTDEAEDAWVHWLRHGVGRRHEIVHGRDEADDDDAEWAIAFADRMRTWITIRLVAGSEGPFAGLFVEKIEEARRLYAQSLGVGSADTPSDVDRG